MKFCLLGPLTVETDQGRRIEFSRSKAVQVLALLVSRCGETVSVDTMIEELWGSAPPPTVMPTLQTYVYHLRRRLAREGADSARLLATRAQGYQLCVSPEQVDERIFTQHLERGQSELERQRPEQARQAAAEALALWRGPALASVRTGDVLAAHVAWLNEMRVRAECISIEAKRQLGRHHEIVPELRSMVAAHPLNESLHAWLIEALYRSGRRAEALGAYRDLWSTLDVELGVLPSREVQQLQREILQLDDGQLGGPRRGRRAS